MEAAIAWLVQTILATLLVDKMEEWIRQVGLADDVERLQSEAERVEMVVAAVKGRAAGNRPLSRSLTRLKELLYDADDIVDELDYYRLQQLVEGDQVDPSRGNSDIPTSSRGGKKRRSKAWENFDVTEEDDSEKPVRARCKHCLTEPPNPSSTGDATANATSVLVGDSSGRKRRRTSEEPAQITAANSTQPPWDKAELSNRMQQITDQLQVIRGEVSEVLKLYRLDSASSSIHSASTTANQHRRTSSLAPRKVYGRVVERNYIMKLIAENKSDSITVLPIVGIAGVGKTALTQLVYNDPDEESLFDHRIWISVSHNFDEMRLTMELLSFVSPERHEGTNCFARLQENLKSHVKSKRVLLILDDVWDDKNDCRWNQLVAPFKSSGSNGNVILVTTRKPSVANMIGTAGPINLGALKNDDFWLLFKSCAFGDGNHVHLSTIGREIADKLKGNPLAAISTGRLLKDDLTIGHWSNILKKEHWKSLSLIGGIMSALKLSYDELPYPLQQCLSYCSIFPDKYMFLGKDLRLEETGWEYLITLTNMGFFEKVGIEETFSFYHSNCQTNYVICDLTYDFLRVVSRNECATIDGLQCNEMMSTVRHLSIVIDPAYNKDLHGSIPRSKKFEQKLRSVVTSMRRLRTLVLIGRYDNSFFHLFQDIFQNAQHLRLLQMSGTSKEVNSFLCCLVNNTHLRYLKVKAAEEEEAFSQNFSRFCHTQVLDIGSTANPQVSEGINNLVCLRHLIEEKGGCSSIANIGGMTSLQELYDFKVQNSRDFEIMQLQSMNELVQLGVSQLENVKSGDESCGAKLKDKSNLEELSLSWTHSRQYYAYNPKPSVDTTTEVLEGLEPHMNLKHLEISGYNGTTSPTWLASNLSVISLRTLHLDDCGGWRILPSLEKVIEVLVPSLEELVLIKMPKLVRCSSTSVEGLSSSLRLLEIVNCQALKGFDLLENNDNFGIMWQSCLHGLQKLMLLDCPQLEVLPPLPPSTACSDFLISGVSSFSYMGGSSSEKLSIGDDDGGFDGFDGTCDSLRILDDKILMFRNLRNLKSMVIYGCRNLRSISFKGFSYLVSLTSLEIRDLPMKTCQLKITMHSPLESLGILYCDIAGKWLSLMLQHAYISGNPDDGLAPDGLSHIPLNLIPLIKRINIETCPRLTFNRGKEGTSGFTSLEKLIILDHPSLLSSLVWQSPGLRSLQLHSCTALEELVIATGASLTALEGLQSLGSLKGLTLNSCPGWTMVYGLCSRLETLKIDDPSFLTTSFCNHLTSLQRLVLSELEKVTRLTDEQELSLVLHKSLQELRFSFCSDLVDLPAGLHDLPSLKSLEIRGCRGISRLPETGLPLFLELLEIYLCSKDLADQCRLLATSKLKVVIT
ncbi:hypothetical protein VPH35_023500 [Triticum aestivum]